MASEKKPSIYSDRGTIGSSDELDEYGVWVKSEPQDLSSVNADIQEAIEPSSAVIEELPDFDTDLGGEESLDFAEEDFSVPDLDIPEETDEPGDDSLDFDDLSIPEESPSPSAVKDDFTEVSMSDFLDGGSDDLQEPAQEPAADSGFKAPPVEKTSAGEDLSTQLLMKIADELSSIRSELSILKKEFSAVRKESAAEDKGETQKKGFFDEEEDEKIALTGDELDNILNTADFTEEAGADATEELPGAYPSMETEGLMPSDPFQVIEESALPDLLSDQDDIIGAEEEAEADSEEEAPPELEYEVEDQDGENPELDDIVIDLDFDDIDPDALIEGSPLEGLDVSGGGNSIDIPDLDINFDDPAVETAGLDDLDIPPLEETGDPQELQQLRTMGAQPMTPAPEDTSYLDDETGAAPSEPAGDIPSEDLSLDEPALMDVAGDDDFSIDLSGAVIDEPDLSGSITENPLQEPSLDDDMQDISIDLDMEEEISADSPEDSSIEITPDFAETGDEEIELSIPGEEDAVDLNIPDDTPAQESSFPEEESFAQVIPEGFVVETGDSQGVLDDDLEEDALSEGDIDTLEKGSETLSLDQAAADQIPEEVSLSDDEGLDIPTGIKQELRTVLSYMDQLLESLPEDKIEEFARSEYFDTYKKLFKELGLD
ncbi:MAG: hypothetical protein LBK02_08300 [Treponema sp.]|jgi:hypothetical protein|nr:hypothetical protein [Treponema sp.]